MNQTKEVPSKAEIALLDTFVGLPLDRIFVPATQKEAFAAMAELSKARFVGFDTESKPTFHKGEISTGPHTVQLSTLERCYIFQVYRNECRSVLTEILQSTRLIKVGFGLKSDLQLLRKKLGIEPDGIIDLDSLFRKEGYRKDVGVKAGVAIVFKKRFQKPKSVTTSNWSYPVLRTNQLLYAANDAYAAIKVFDSLGVK